MKCFTVRLNAFRNRFYSRTEPGMTRPYAAFNTGIFTYFSVTGSALVDPALLQDGINTHDQRARDVVVIWNCSVEPAGEGQSEQFRLVPTKDGENEALIEVESELATTMDKHWPGLLVEGLRVYDYSFVGRPLVPECRHRLIRLKAGESTVITVSQKPGSVFGCAVGSEKLVDFRISFDGKKVTATRENGRLVNAAFRVHEVVADLYVALMLMFLTGMVGGFICLSDRKFQLGVILWALTAGLALKLLITGMRGIYHYINRPVLEE